MYKKSIENGNSVVEAKSFVGPNNNFIQRNC